MSIKQGADKFKEKPSGFFSSKALYEDHQTLQVPSGVKNRQLFLAMAGGDKKCAIDLIKKGNRIEDEELESFKQIKNKSLSYDGEEKIILDQKEFDEMLFFGRAYKFVDDKKKQEQLREEIHSLCMKSENYQSFNYSLASKIAGILGVDAQDSTYQAIMGEVNPKLQEMFSAQKKAQEEARENIGGMIVDMVLSAISAAFGLHLDAARKSMKESDVGGKFAEDIKGKFAEDIKGKFAAKLKAEESQQGQSSQVGL